jgi:hypothetical protein
MFVVAVVAVVVAVNVVLFFVLVILCLANKYFLNKTH